MQLDLTLLSAHRAQLLDRFAARMTDTPSRGDPAPLGEGPRNAHGMPRLPPGQTPTQSWPIFDLDIRPHIAPCNWRLQVTGAMATPTTFDWEALLALPQVDQVSDFHSHKGWSLLDVPWHGVRLADVLALCLPAPGTTHLLAHSADGFTTSLPLWEALKDNVLLAYEAHGKQLAIDHGGPLRLVVPELWAYKSAKWVARIELLTSYRPGFWEQRGYPVDAYPWRGVRPS